jgi:hypothetical protein
VFCFVCDLGPVLGNQLWRDKPEREIDQRWNEDNIVQVTNHWNEVGNQIERHTKIAHGKTQKYLGGKRSSLVSENAPIDCQLALERACEVFALLPHRENTRFTI